MKKIKFALKNIGILALIISSFIACDKDFATIGSDIIGENNFGTNNTKYDVIAYNKKLDPVQTNNLPVNLLGVYNDPVYGLSTANFVTQLTSSLINPDFGTGVQIDSVILTVPFFSRAVELNAEGNTIYELDSVFNRENPIKLSIYRNNYFLRDFDPNLGFNSPQRYYSNASTSTTNNISSAALEGELLATIGNFYYPNLNSFVPSKKQIVLRNATGEETTRIAPALRLKLEKNFWKQNILDKQGEPELSNANNFANYFRGLYFKTEAINGKGNLSLLNFGSPNANVTIYYTKDPLVEGGDRVEATFVLSFTGNRVNFISNNFNFPLQDGNTTTGDEKLYLKGGEGSMAVINLFNGGEDGTSTEFNSFLNSFKDPLTGKVKRLVNEANLVFYVDQNTMLGQVEPERVYLYDLNNNIPLVDYYLDFTNSSNPNFSKTDHLGKLVREGGTSTGAGIKYKIRITEHINSILLKDSTNVKLGLAVSANVNLENTFLPYYLLSNDATDVVKRTPVSSIISPRGTVLHGNNTSNEAKKLYLEIFYTEPNN